MSSTGIAKAEELNADLVVIGGGGGGLAAALAATERGVSVIVLEMRRITGGNSALALGLFTVGKPGQEQEDIANYIDEYFRTSIGYSHWRNNPRIVRALIEKSADVILWLEAQGVKFEWDDSMQGYLIGGEGKGGANLMKALAKRCQDIGVQILCQTRARKLLTSQAGRVTGVLAEEKRKEIRITAKNVIIATGGFAGNKELLKKYLPNYNEEASTHIHLGGLPHQGDGLLMATEIGAATDGLVFLECSRLVMPVSEYLSNMSNRPSTIWVNKKGERFVDESIIFPEAANSIFRQPDKTFFTVFDEKTKQAIFDKGTSPMENRTIPAGSWPAQADKDLQLQADKGRVKISDSWEEMASWMDAAPEALKATIDEYNAGCDRKHDIFLKDPQYLSPLRTPPYYAIKCGINLLVTHGDIKVNHRMEVLDAKDNPIPGLYAVGDDASIADSDTYNMNLRGHSLGFAVNSGRIAGENAAKSAGR